MRKIAIFFGRVKTMSFKKMFMMIKQIHKEYHKSSLVIFIDMVYCALKENIGYQDYRVFGFAGVPFKERKTFLTMNKNLELVRRYNNKDTYAIYRDKTLFFKKFEAFLHRDWIDLNKKTAHDLEKFCKGKESIFVKTPCAFGGQGIGEIKITPITSFDTLYNDLIKSGQTLVEEKILQHDKMKSLHPESINTLRIVTLTRNGKVNVISRLLRMGQQGSVVDNITSGGIYASINENGIVDHPAFCDKTGETFSHHPTTGTKIHGFEIPYFNEAMALVEEIATAETNMSYIGWDIAITPDGPVIVEGNNVPSYEIMQNHVHRNNNQGLIPLIESILGEKL